MFLEFNVYFEHKMPVVTRSVFKFKILPNIYGRIFHLMFLITLVLIKFSSWKGTPQQIG